MAGGALFPLPSNFFPSMELSAEENTSFQEWGDRLLRETIDAYHRDQLDSHDQRERKWKALKARGGLTAFRRRKAAAEDDYRYLCTGVIEGTLDEVIRGRYADNTDDFRRVSAVYRDDLVDCAVLHTIERESAARPFYYAGFKWMTVQSPGKGLVKNRDVCWYEQMGLARDRNGKEIGYTLTESVDLPNCPTFSDCVRAKLSVCYLYRRNKSGGVKVYMRGRNNAGGKVLEYIADQKSAELWLRVDRAMAVTHAAIATAFVECSKSAPRMNFEKKKCEICEDRIGTIMSSTKQCAMCHRFTCARCIVKKRVLSPLVDFKAVCRENFCKKCLRFISDVNLREPQSIHDVWNFAISSTSDSSQRSYVRQFESDRGTDSSRDTDDSQQGLMSTRSVAESTASDDSDRSFRHMPPPPTISAKPAPQFQQQHLQQQRAQHHPHHSHKALPSPSTQHKPPMRPNMDLLQPTSSSLPVGPVTLYEGEARGPMSRSVDGYPRHIPQYASSPASSTSSSSRRGRGQPPSYDQPPSFASEHAYQMSPPASTRSNSSRGGQDYDSRALTAAGHSVYSASPRAVVEANNAHAAAYTPDAMMAQMIKMNLMAEKAQAMVEQNDRIARGYTPRY